MEIYSGFPGYDSLRPKRDRMRELYGSVENADGKSGR